MKRLITAFVILHSSFVIPLAAQTEAVLQKKSDGTLLRDVATGAKTFTVSATGTLEWVSGATLDGASLFRAAAGLDIGSDVQAYSANLTTFAAIAPSANVQTLLGAADYAAFRSSLGLGTAAIVDTGTASGNVPLITDNTLYGPTLGQFSRASDPEQYASIYYGGIEWRDVDNSGFYHALILAAPTANRTHTLPNVSGTIITTGNLSSITTTGTITSGVWQGTDIALAYIAQGSATDGQVMLWDNTAGTWEPGTLTGGLTINTTTTSGAASGDILTSDGTLLQKLTPGTGVATWLATPSKANLNAAVSDDDPAYVGAANTYTEVQTLKALRLGSSDGAYIRDGYEVTPGDINQKGRIVLSGGDAYGVQLSSSGGIWSTLGTLSSGGGYGSPYYSGLLQMLADHVLLYGAGGVVQVRNSTTAQAVQVYNTYTSATNHEVAVLDWQTTANTLRLGSDVGSGGGTARDVNIIRGGTVKATFGANTTDHEQPVKLKSYIVSGLPSASTCGAGSMAWVTDATATTAYSVVAGGGSNQVLVISDGTDWRIH